MVVAGNPKFSRQPVPILVAEGRWLGRNDSRLRNFSLACLVSISIVPCIGHAQALDPSAIQPRMVPVVDGQGVDLADIAIFATLPSLESAGLTHSATVNMIASDGWSTFGPQFNNNFNTVNYIPYRSPALYTVSFNGHSEVYSAGVPNQVYGANNKFTCSGTFSCTYRLNDGTVVKYSQDYYALNGALYAVAVASEVDKADGEIIKYKYWHRNDGQIFIGSASSSLGWVINYDYTNNSNGSISFGKIYIVNSSIDYCNDSASATNLAYQNNCTIAGASIPPTQTWSIDAVGYKYYNYDNQLIQTDTLTSQAMPSGAAKTLSGTDVHRGSYSWSNSYGYINNGANLITTATDANGNTRIMNSMVTFHMPLSYKDESGNLTKYTYYENSEDYHVKQVISPEATYSGSTLVGGYTEYIWSSGLLFQSKTYPVHGGTPLVTTYTYDEFCLPDNVRCARKVATVEDPKHNVTTYTYSHVHGGLTSEVSAPDSSGNRSATYYDYTMFTPKVRNGAGVLVDSTPVYKLTWIWSCSVNASPCPAANLKSTTFTYDINHNLRLLSETVSDGNAVLSQPPSATNLYGTTTYTYNYAGFVTSIDGPRTDVDDVSYITYDHMYRPVFEIGPDPDGTGALKRRFVKHLYDGDGREYRTEIGTTNTTDGSDYTASSVMSYTENKYDNASGDLIQTKTATVP